MSLRDRIIDYRDGDAVLEGRLAWDDRFDGPRPGVLVSHAWGGRGTAEDGKADRLAELGYVALALDVYGKGRRGATPAENAALMQPFVDDRVMLQRRMRAALTTLCAQPEVDPRRAAAIGFCFGGLCVLDLARSGAPLAGVVSFHGLLSPPGNTAGNRVNAKILVLHGWDDPMATPDSVLALAAELTSLGADWQLHAYGNTLHAFSNPAANNPAMGTVYNADADRRSWAAMRHFLLELFGA